MKELTLTVSGAEDGDIEAGLEEAIRLVREGFTSGFDENDTGKFVFDIEEGRE